MGIPCYLAMTAAEIGDFSKLPERIAWMACQFSSWGTGLSNLPPALPAGSILTLNDQMPIHGHDPTRILSELESCAERLPCSAVLLDFQRPEEPETEALVSELKSLSLPLVVSHFYARDRRDAVLVPPCPPSVPLKEHITPWQGREIWLELALDGEVISLTEQGAVASLLPYPDLDATGFIEQTLHCHYRAALKTDAAEFTLWRTREDLAGLLEEAEALGVAGSVGLYQELHGWKKAM